MQRFILNDFSASWSLDKGETTYAGLSQSWLMRPSLFSFVNNVVAADRSALVCSRMVSLLLTRFRQHVSTQYTPHPADDMYAVFALAAFYYRSNDHDVSSEVFHSYPGIYDDDGFFSPASCCHD